MTLINTSANTCNHIVHVFPLGGNEPTPAGISLWLLLIALFRIHEHELKYNCENVELRRQHRCCTTFIYQQRSNTIRLYAPKINRIVA